MRIQKSHSETVVTSDGAQGHSVVRVSETSCYDLERIDDFDDLYQCGLAHAQRMGQMEAFTERFNAAACCDASEQAMIAALKDFLRPQQAPSDLLGRVMQRLDMICDEEEAQAHTSAGFVSSSTHQDQVPDGSAAQADYSASEQGERLTGSNTTESTNDAEEAAERVEHRIGFMPR